MGLLARLIPNRLLQKAAGTQERLATPEERALLLSVPDVARLGYPIDFDADIERVVYRSYPDGSCELKYTYDPDQLQPGGNHILLITRAERENTIAEAHSTFELGLKAFALGARLERSNLEGSRSPKEWCSSVFCGYLMNEDAVATATVLSVHRHRLIYSVIARGIVARTNEDIDELIYEPCMRASGWAAS